MIRARSARAETSTGAEYTHSRLTEAKRRDAILRFCTAIKIQYNLTIVWLPSMYGPEQPGKWSSLVAANCGRRHQFLRAGERYRVTREFIDYDKSVHLPGEEWVFLGYSFLPYDSGMSFFVSLDGVREWHIRLQWIPEEQGEMLDHLADYITLVPSPS